jgi:S1-C subfamily serine protease
MTRLARGKKMKNDKAVGTLLLVMLLSSMFGALIWVQKCTATNSGYSPAMIGELGEAATVLIYSQIDATVKIYVPDANWIPTAEYILVTVSTGAMGSGAFVTSNGYIVTAGHVVFSFTHANIAQDLYTKYFLINASFAVLLQALENAGYSFTLPEQIQLLTYIQQYAELQDSLRQVYAVLGEVKTTLTDIQSKGWVARVVSVSPYIERDLALLKVEGLSNCPVLVVGDSDNVVTGDDVYMFGFPGVVTFHAELGPETMLAPSMTRGIISAKRFTNVQTPCFQTDAMITHGNSGGPGLNNNAEIVGICSRGSVSETGQEVAGFDFLIQGNVLKTFLAESSVNNTEGPVDEAFIRGLTYYYGKHYSAAKAEFETIAGLFDYHWRAKTLITECASAIARGQDVPLGVSMDTWTLIIIVGGVMATAVVAVAVVVFTHRRRTQNLPPPPPVN